MHAVVPQGDAGLAVEEGHVAVEFEELPAHGLPGHRQPLDHAAREEMLADDLVQVGLVCDAVEDLVGPDQHVGELAGLRPRAGAEATGRRARATCSGADARRRGASRPDVRGTACSPFQPQRTLPQINSS